MMDSTLHGVPDTSWQTIADRLKSAGVFADEEQRLPGEPTLRGALQDVEREARQRGYAGGHLDVGSMAESQEGVDYLVFDTRRFNTPLEAVAAWRSDYNERWHRTVELSVADWIERLNALKQAITSWLPPGMTTVDLPPTRMHEELMRRFGVPPAEMPTFDIVRGDQRIMRVQPKALWVIGANGRVDLTTRTRSLILVDESAPRSGHPRWKYYTSKDRRYGADLNRDSFVGLLN